MLTLSKIRQLFRGGWPLLAGLLTGIVVFLVFDRLHQNEIRQMQQMRMHDVRNRLELIEGRIESALDARSAKVHSLTTFVRMNPQFTSEAFTRLATLLSEGDPAISAVELTRGSVITHVFPLEGNAAAIGLDLKRVRDEWAVIDLGIRERINTITGPVRLVQGGLGVIVRRPIFIKNEFWGLAIIVIDMETLLDECGLDSFSDLEIAIQGRKGRTISSVPFWGEAAVLEDPLRVQAEISLADGIWIITGREPATSSPLVVRSRVTKYTTSILLGILVWVVAGIPRNFRLVADRARADLRSAQDKVGRLEALQSLGVLAGGIAHDFNNFLSAMLGHIELIRIFSREQKSFDRELEDLQLTVERSASLSRQLLTFSKGGTPVTEVQELGPLLESQIRFALSGSPIEISIDIDGGQFSQVIHNLVVNAREALGSGGRLDVTATNTVFQDGRAGIRLSIADDGPGIPKDVLPHVFEPFFTTKPEGSGIGLPLVTSIVDQHGGRVDVRSSPAGTTFDIDLPRAQGEIVPVADRCTILEPLDILVVDDNEHLLEVIQRMLMVLGHRPVLATNGPAALRMVKDLEATGQSFDLVILDLVIPGSAGGVEILRKLRKTAPGLVAIATSGYETNQVMASPGEYGFQGTLPKPFNLEHLAGVLARTWNEKDREPEA